MARQKEATFITEQKPFPKRLRELIIEKHASQAELAKYVKCTRQVISLYATGQSTPDIEILIKLAQYFNVSADYLLGLTDVKTSNIDIHAINKMLGLSEEVIEVISNFDSEKQKTLSNIIENDKFGEILSGINDVVNQKSLYNQFILEMIERVNKADESAMINISSTLVGYGDAHAYAHNVNTADDSKTVNAKEYIEVLRYRLKNILEDIINEVTYSKDFDTDILTRFKQLIRTDDNDLLYGLKISSLKMVQNGEWKKFLREKMKNYGWSKA